MKVPFQIAIEFADYARKNSGHLYALWSEFIQSRPEKPAISANKLVKHVCLKMNVIEEIFYSHYKYGNLHKARMVVVLIMRKLKYRNQEIASALGWSDGRTSATYNRAVYQYEKNEQFKELFDEIFESVKEDFINYIS